MARAAGATVPEDVLREVLKLAEAQKTLEVRQSAQNNFLPFVHHVYDGFIEGRHHRIFAEKIEAMARGDIKRLIVNMGPRHTKSEFASYLMPAWFIGRNPRLKIIQASHNLELAMRFGRKTRDLVHDPRYRDIFPNTMLKEDSKSAGRWETSQGGEYFAAGVGSTVTGRGADLFIIDDPHSEQDALSPDTSFANAYEWYTSGPRQRLQPGASICVVMTRWGKKDLTGRLLQAQSADPLADQWEVVEFPAILPSGNPLWPEFWDKASLLGIKASLPEAKWQAQWQQRPSSSEAAIIKREWWQDWGKDSVPDIQYILQSYDTAFSAKETADYSAITTWGVFTPKAGEPPHLILLDARRGRWGFPDLRQTAIEENDYWKPDMIIIEARGSGQPLADELRKADLPVVTFAPSRKAGGGGMDKRTRMHMVSPLFEGGRVWAPLHKKFADEVIEEVSTFGTGDHDDYCDSMTMALIRFRQGGFVMLDGEEDEEEKYESRRRRYY